MMNCNFAFRDLNQIVPTGAVIAGIFTNLF